MCIRDRSCSVRVAGDKFDEAIISYVKKKYNLLIGERTAEEIKIAIGSAFPTGSEEDRASVEIKGRNLVDGLPKNVTISAEEVREALSDPLAVIVDAIKSTLEKTPPELSADTVSYTHLRKRPLHSRVPRPMRKRFPASHW